MSEEDLNEVNIEIIRNKLWKVCELCLRPLTRPLGIFGGLLPLL